MKVGQKDSFILDYWNMLINKIIGKYVMLGPTATVGDETSWKGLI